MPSGEAGELRLDEAQRQAGAAVIVPDDFAGRVEFRPVPGLEPALELALDALVLDGDDDHAARPAGLRGADFPSRHPRPARKAPRA